MSDVAFLLAHSVSPDLLDSVSSGEKRLRDFYLKELREGVARKIRGQLRRSDPPYRQDEKLEEPGKYHPRKEQIEQLLSAQPSESNDKIGQYLYPDEIASRHYDLAVVDYARFVIGRFWTDISHETLQKKADKPNVTLPNRSLKAALRFVDNVDRCLYRSFER